MAETPETETKVVETVTEVAQKKFEIPSIDEVVLAIKELDEEIEHISLNLIKANFNATEDDVRKAFPEYKDKFLKVKQYKPGSFEVVFAARMDAIDFVRGAPGKKILGR
jgi:plasmid replication initiation protein